MRLLALPGRNAREAGCWAETGRGHGATRAATPLDRACLPPLQERYERLAHEEAARRAARRAAKEAEVYGSLDFRPQLNSRSLAMAPAGSGGVEALASAEKKQRKLEELLRGEEERRRAECTFQAGLLVAGISCQQAWGEVVGLREGWRPAVGSEST